MAPVPVKASDVSSVVEVDGVVVFSKTTCPFCVKVKDLFKRIGVSPRYVELDELPGDEGAKVQDALKEKTGQATVPNVFVNGVHLGGCDDAIKANNSGKLSGMLTQTKDEAHEYDYDLIVIGGGSGGLAASKEAARLNRKVAVCDFVKPSPPGTTWGLGGTCVNVGCIPKKLMHQASLCGEFRKDAGSFGWPSAGADDKVDWPKMVENIQSHIGSLNWGYRVALRDKKVKYLNELASFVDAHTLKTVKKNGKESTVTAKNFILAMGGRPKYPDIPGAKEFGITSDDIFSLPYNPGKTLCVGASYISLECAGFLHGIGVSATVMVRSILLRGFDQQIAAKIGDFMEAEGMNFVRECVPTSIEVIEEGTPRKLRVKGKYNDGTEFEDWFNTVLFAIGRDPDTNNVGLEAAGVKLSEKTGKVLHDEQERTSAPHIYAIGDILDGKPELTPMAIQSGILLARRLCKVSDILTDYINVPTTVFTPLEYGAVGYSEEDANAKFGEDNIEVFHKNFWPLEWTLSKRPENACYAKLVCDNTNGDYKVVGFHYLGPNAGEVTQGFAGMIQMGAKKSDFDRLVGIHPTTAEIFTTLDISKSSGVDPSASGC